MTFLQATTGRRFLQDTKQSNRHVLRCKINPLPGLKQPTRCPQGGITALSQSYLRVTSELPTRAYRLAIELL